MAAPAAAPTPADEPDPATAPIADREAEKLLLRAAMTSAFLYQQASDAGLTGIHFHNPVNERIWYAAATLHARGADAGPVNIAAELARRSDGIRIPDDHIIGIYLGDPPVETATYATYLVRLWQRRTLATLATRLEQAARSGADITDTLTTVRQFVADAAEDVTPAAARVPDIDAYLADGGDDDGYDWLIPGLLERGDRLIVTGGEGHGKSTLLRQIAIQAAAGVHPFTSETVAPVKVLHLDLENSDRQSRRKYRPLRLAAGPSLDPANLRVLTKLDGIDLTDPDDVQWLGSLVEHVKPDLLVTGPVYKMASGDPNEEKSAKPVAMALDRLRARTGITLILEAHSSKALNGSRKRAHEPYGWSGWLRWPEFGVWLDKDGDLVHWRGMRDEREFPELLIRGGKWPWMPAQSPDEVKWERIRKCILDAGEKLTQREIAQRTGISAGTVNKVLRTYSMQYTALIYKISAEDDDE